MVLEKPRERSPEFQGFLTEAPLAIEVVAALGSVRRGALRPIGRLSILGRVTDGTGSVVPGASVVVTDQSTCVAATVVSSVVGAFEVRYPYLVTTWAA